AGSYSITAVTEDAAGNVSDASPAFRFVIDTLAEAPLITGLSPDSDSGVQGDTATNDTTPDFRGTAEPLATVTVRAGTSLIATTLADELGNWSAAYIAAPLPPGFHAVTASIVDLAGHVRGALV